MEASLVGRVESTRKESEVFRAMPSAPADQRCEDAEETSMSTSDDPFAVLAATSALRGVELRLGIAPNKDVPSMEGAAS